MMTKYIGTATGLAYVLIGAWLVLKHPLTDNMPVLWQNVLGGLLMAYGLFRVWSRLSKNAN
jgi:hypothetical protein